MIDWNDQNAVLELTETIITFSKQFAQERRLAAQAKTTFDIHLAKHWEELRKKKANLGYETAQIMILELGNKEVLTAYTEYMFHEAQYKGLEKVIEALQTQVSVIQSIMRNTTRHGG